MVSDRSIQPARPLIRLIDLRTQVHSKRDVTLVGAMHYNPVSIALAERCVEEQEGLGAVVVESVSYTHLTLPTILRV